MPKIFTSPIFRISGDTGLIVDLGEGVSMEITRIVRNLALTLENAEYVGIQELIPSYSSLLVVYDPTLVCRNELQEFINGILSNLDHQDFPSENIIDIPVSYGGAFGPDIQYVSEFTGLTVRQVIEIHTAPTYQIFMMGFTPGFPFLGGLDPRLKVPRLNTPRTLVKAGSVGIANNQTGVYPVDSPGGWRIIGRTMLELFSPHKNYPFLYSVGDFIRFVDIAP